jgi:hypothetical protein
MTISCRDLDRLDGQIQREQRLARHEASVEETRGQRRPIAEGGEGRGAEGGEEITYRRRSTATLPRG